MKELSLVGAPASLQAISGTASETLGFRQRFRTLKSALVFPLSAGLVLLNACTAQSDSEPVPDQPKPIYAAKAECGEGDRVETGLQGQMTLAERFAPGPAKAFNCNLELVGQYSGNGASPSFAISDKCAFVGQWYDYRKKVVLDTPGAVVLDIADAADPKVARYLTTGGMLNSNESIAYNPKTKVLLAQNYPYLGGTNAQGLSPDIPLVTDVYDASDCSNPVLKFSDVIPGFVYHSGVFSPDGTIFWAATSVIPPEEGESQLSALDVSDPSNPKLLATWVPAKDQVWSFHDVSVSADGNTAYALIIGMGMPQGLAILDIGDVQARKPDAQIKLLSDLIWEDSKTDLSQFTQPMTINGHHYLYHTGARMFGGPGGGREAACKAGQAVWRPLSIIDVEDPEKPFRPYNLMLEIDDPAKCSQSIHDSESGFYDFVGKCAVDDPKDAKLLACARGESGLRVFDIRDIEHPREIAYYKPPATGLQPRLGSSWVMMQDEPQKGPSKPHTADGVLIPYFAKGGKEIWFVSGDNGFQIVRFSDELMAREKDLFARPKVASR